MLKLDPRQAPFSLAEARAIVSDLFTPNPLLFWADFLLSWTVGVVCFSLVARVESGSPTQVALFIVSSLAIYRASLFIHEIVHLRQGTFRAFRFAWNLLAGIPFLVPSFLYYTHLDHHRRTHYGTKQDGEYLPLGTQSPIAILLYLLQPFFIPLLAILRFTLLTPLTWISPPLRRWVSRHASSMVMDPMYVRPMPTPAVLKIWRLQEFGCWLFCLAIAVLLVRGLSADVPPEAFERPLRNGVLPLSFLVQAYLTGFFIALVNNIRTLGAHRFLNDGRELTFLEQLLDSVNFPRPSLVHLASMPVGLRFHALHHLFPSLPYHNLGRAHRRLMRELPADSPYRLTECDRLGTALRQLWNEAQHASRKRQVLSRPSQTAGAT